MAKKSKIVLDIESAERRAKQKLGRLKRKGINVETINPIKDTSNMTLVEKRNYVKQTNIWINDRQYEKGADGAPIDKRYVAQLRYTEKAINVQRSKRYGYSNIDPEKVDTFMGSRKLSELHEAERLSGKTSTAPLPPRKISSIKSEKDLEKYLKKLHYISTPEYRSKKMATLRDNMEIRAKRLGSPELVSILAKLSDDEIDMLYAKSDFLEVLFFQSGAKQGISDVEAMAQNIVMDDQLESLFDSIARINKDVFDGEDPEELSLF